MAAVAFYRGGSSLAPRRGELRFDPLTGDVLPTHGVSVFDRPDGLDRFGGAYRLNNVPDTLRIIHRGRDPHHHEIVPAFPMPRDEYEKALAGIVLTPA